MQLTDVLLVTRNYAGMCEENSISTIDEFIKRYCDYDDPSCEDMLRKVVSGAEPYAWDGHHYVSGNDSYDIRLCQGPEDLLKFLAGGYNDSIKAMEDRMAGTSGNYDHWYWENRPDRFSVLALEAVKSFALEKAPGRAAFRSRLLTVLPDVPFARDLVRNQSNHRLDDFIKEAQKNKPITGRQNRTLSSLEL